MNNSSDSEASSSKKPFKCTKPDCSVSFSKNSRLIWHERQHTGERPFVCDEEGCDKTYTNSSHLRRHKSVSHSGKKPEGKVCPHEDCGATLNSEDALKRHIARKHNLPFNCDECGRGFRKKEKLQQHVYVHTGELAFSCDKCDGNFKTARNLHKHQQKHRVYNCDCGQIFHRWLLLLAHKKSCGEPRFKCEVCGKTFSHLGNFETHKLSHKDESEKLRFGCPFSKCDRSYSYKKNLRSHINVFHKKVKKKPSLKCTFANCQVVLKTKELRKTPSPNTLAMEKEEEESAS